LGRWRHAGSTRVTSDHRTNPERDYVRDAAATAAPPVAATPVASSSRNDRANNVVSGKTFIERGAENLHLDATRAAERLDERLRELTGFRLDEETPLPYAKHVKVPTLMTQLRRDFLIHGERDGQAIFDALGAQQKELLWIDQF
jgi:hypothetical protein